MELIKSRIDRSNESLYKLLADIKYLNSIIFFIHLLILSFIIEPP